jgi:dTMP kinase
VRGLFITFEGIDGAGKSTHLAGATARLRDAGRSLQVTREPGGTELSERIRELLLTAPMDALTETLLVFAARRDHLQQVILPALAQGHDVLCDRFTDASFAYQGAGRGLELSVLTQLESWTHPDLQPDLTLWFDLGADVAAARRAAARTADRFERQDEAFFERVRMGYAARANANPKRFKRIDAAAAQADVAQQVELAIQQVLR